MFTGTSGHFFTLLAEEWQAIKLVATWLKSFRATTTQMSMTQTPMLSTTHAVFHSLQDELREIIQDLPDSVPPSLKQGLTDAHRKLSDYYYKIDNRCIISGHLVSVVNYYVPLHILIMISVLDPCISCEALQEDFAHDTTLLAQLESSKLNLRLHFNTNYNSPRNSSSSTRLSSTATSSLLSVTSEPTSTASNPNSSPQKNYTARYSQKCAAVDELTEFWNMPQEDFKTCNLVQWWQQWRAQFPNLYHLAHNIFSIPGIFSTVIFVYAIYSLRLLVGF